MFSAGGAGCVLGAVANGRRLRNMQTISMAATVSSSMVPLRSDEVNRDMAQGLQEIRCEHYGNEQRCHVAYDEQGGAVERGAQSTPVGELVVQKPFRGIPANIYT